MQPPEDPAELGALNRALAARGVAWRYGAPLIEPATTDSGALVGRVRVLRRYRLETGQSGRTGVLATVNGAPWLVRSGDVVLLGSRLDPAWTDLPVSAGLHAVHGRAGEPAGPRARCRWRTARRAIPCRCPISSPTSGRASATGGWRAAACFGRASPAPTTSLAGDDTVGAITANIDPRESLLAPATDAQARRLWKGARLVSLGDVGDAVFSGAARGDLRGPLLWAALLLALAETALASVWRRQAR